MRTIVGVFGCISLIALFCASCDPIFLDVQRPAGRDNLHHLDLDHPTVTQPIESNDAAEARKFVRVEVTEVINPKKYAVTFAVDYLMNHDTRIRLGEFSLFPADNPGKFIVPTQRKVKNQGALVLSLHTPDTVGRGDELRVTVQRMRFVNE